MESRKINQVKYDKNVEKKKKKERKDKIKTVIMKNKRTKIT